MNFDSTTILAVIGAITGTSALIWDIHKWRKSEPNLRVRILAGGKLLHGSDSNKKFDVISVSNGRYKTTIQAIEFCLYENWIQKLRGKSKESFMVNPLKQTLPKVLEVGEIFTTQPIPSQIENKASMGPLYCRVYHTQSDKPVQIRVLPKKTINTVTND